MEVHYTQGEYVTRFDHKQLGVDVTLSVKVKKEALRIMGDKKLRYRMAARGIKALTLTKAVWEKAYKILEDES